MSIRNATLALIVLVGASASASSVEAQYYDRWEIGYPHIEVGFDVGVMIWNGVDRDIVRPGGTVDVPSKQVLARAGDRFHILVPRGLRKPHLDARLRVTVRDA